MFVIREVYINGFSSRSWRNLTPHMGDPHGDPQTSPQHADLHGLGAFVKITMQEIHVDRRVEGWSVGRHVDHPCLARKVTDYRFAQFLQRLQPFQANLLDSATVQARDHCARSLGPEKLE